MTKNIRKTNRKNNEVKATLAATCITCEIMAFACFASGVVLSVASIVVCFCM